MEFYSVSITWTKADETQGSIKFVCAKPQIMNQLNQALTTEVAPSFGRGAHIDVSVIGQVRGPVA